MKGTGVLFGAIALVFTKGLLFKLALVCPFQVMV